MSFPNKKIVVDTNVLFMALYNPLGKAAKIIEFANQDKVELYSPESVRLELIRVLERELDFSDEEIDFVLKELPVMWINREIYQSFIEKTKVKHKPDKPVEALALLLGCGILSADTDFKEKINIDELIESLEE